MGCEGKEIMPKILEMKMSRLTEVQQKAVDDMRSRLKARGLPLTAALELENRFIYENCQDAYNRLLDSVSLKTNPPYGGESCQD